MVGFIYTTSGASNTYYYDKNIRGDVLGIYDASGAQIVKYSYDAWGNCTIDSSTTNTALAKINPIRYRGYYYDEDIKLYLNSRYYGPLWRRFLSPDSTSYLDPQTPNGLNLYAYAGNNPVSLAYPNAGKAISRRNISPELNPISISATKMPSYSKNAFGPFSIANPYKSTNNIFRNLPRANLVKMSHVTDSLIKDPITSKVVGNISYTQTWQMNDAAPIFSFVDIGNDIHNVGVGVNINNWIGYSVFATSAGGLGSTFQITPWFVFSSGWNRESGLSFGGGVIVDDITHELTISVGNGALVALLACAAISLIPVPGAKAVAALGALIIIDALI